MNINRLQTLKLTIAFKNYILSLDVHSRRHVIETCISYMESSEDNLKNKCITWLQNIKNINDNFDSKERKEQIRFDACWDELHLELIKSTIFHHIITIFN